MRPAAVAAAAERLRGRTVGLAADLEPAQLEREAVPGWTVEDVLRHLVSSDRDVLLLRHLKDFLPWVDADDFERVNDTGVERLQHLGRDELVGALERWGSRLRWVIRSTPPLLAGIEVPTLFGRVPLWWVATLRVYDEWVHQWDVATALDLAEPAMDGDTRDLLAEFHLRALPAKPLTHVRQQRGVVEVRLADAPRVPWRFDLFSRKYGPRVADPATVTVVTDVPTWTLVAADRVPWRVAARAGDLRLDGEDHAAAEALLDVVRVV